MSTITTCKENMPKKTSLENGKIETGKQENHGFATATADLFKQKSTVVLQYSPNPTPFPAEMKFVFGQNEKRFG